jgi:predicted ATPase
LRGIASQLVNLVAYRIVKPFRHVAPDELNRGHAADLVRVRLPQRAVQWATRLLAPSFDGLGNFDFLKLARRQSAVVHDHRLARIRIHHAADVGARAWYSVSMAPEVTQLGSFTSDDK